MKSRRVNSIRSKFNNLRSQIFLQFIVILFIIVAVVLLSSSSFYMYMIESLTIPDFKSAITELENCDITESNAIYKIEDIERKNDVTIEIYGKNSPNSDKFDKNIYTKYAHDVYYTNSADYSRYDHYDPMVDFINNEFKVMRDYSDGSKVGTLYNVQRQYKYFLMTAESSDHNYLYVAAVRYSILSNQAQAISFVVLITALVIFIALSIVIYFYITRVTKPLTVMNKTIKEMSETNKKELRVPAISGKNISEIDTTIASINMLYSSLILTQEELEEKSEYLAHEIEIRDNEQNSKTKFIADISHELKTPISIIQGYAEGAKFIENDKKALDEYCDTIVEECERMTSLVVNMMSFSDICNNFNDINPETFVITDFINQRLQLHSMLFSKNGIEIDNQITDKICGRADLSKLPFVLNNLLSNAISYIAGNPKVIRLRYEEQEFSYRIFVFNSGNHIPQKKLEMLWQSFYRIDSARVRSGSHFGLGLSIVKSVQDAHSQECGVNNVDGGVEFWFDISK